MYINSYISIYPKDIYTHAVARIRIISCLLYQDLPDFHLILAVIKVQYCGFLCTGLYTEHQKETHTSLNLIFFYRFIHLLAENITDICRYNITHFALCKINPLINSYLG